MSGEEDTAVRARGDAGGDRGTRPGRQRDPLGRAGRGVDPRAVISLTAALQTLDPGAGAGYAAGSRGDRQDGTGYRSDGEFLEALSDAEDQVRERQSAR